MTFLIRLGGDIPMTPTFQNFNLFKEKLGTTMFGARGGGAEPPMMLCLTLQKTWGRGLSPPPVPTSL